jgi:hypothetical protein
MVRAELKASLARAYAAGGRPEFITVMPDGLNEVWQLAGVALVMPVVPPQAPAGLQYALRLRRDTLTSGTCPNCGATPEVAPHDPVGDMPAGTALFNHAPRCSANDDRVMRQMKTYLEAREAQQPDEAVESANKQTRERIAPWKGSGVINTPRGEERALEILAQELYLRGAVNTCSHLALDPAQTWICLIGEGVWRCEQCYEYRGSEVLEALRTGQSGPLNWVDDHTCDLCGKIFVHGLHPLVLRINQYVMHGAYCSSCAEEHAEITREATAAGKDVPTEVSDVPIKPPAGYGERK